ncbi:glyoxalase [Burkholderia sp. SRS-46]|nr:glyoxalase [Burkholderia sp. SRS-46]
MSRARDLGTLRLVDEPPPVATPFQVRAHHCGISIPDLERSISWYRTYLGFTLEYRTMMPAVPFNGAFLRRGSTRIELFELPDAARLPLERCDPITDLKTHGTKHLALEVDDLETAFQWLARRGVDVAFPPFEAHGLAGCYIRDPDGILIELIEHRDGRGFV